MPKIEFEMKPDDVKELKYLEDGYYLIRTLMEIEMISIKGGIVHYHSKNKIEHNMQNEPRNTETIIGKVKDFTITDITLE